VHFASPEAEKQTRNYNVLIRSAPGSQVKVARTNAQHSIYIFSIECHSLDAPAAIGGYKIPSKVFSGKFHNFARFTVSDFHDIIEGYAFGQQCLYAVRSTAPFRGRHLLLFAGAPLCHHWPQRRR
jgi:hypothetical protein